MRWLSFLSLAVLLIGCTQPLPPADTLRVGLGAEPASLDPHLAQGLAEVRVLSAIYEGLVLPFPGKTGDVISGGVANSWQVLEGGCKLVFHLRPEAHWSDGTPVVAQDFVESWKRALTPELAAPNAGLFDAIEGAKKFRQGKGTWKEVGVKTLGDSTLIVRLEQPNPNFLQTLTHPVFYPVKGAKNIPARRGENWVKAGKLVTNGAFTLAEHLPYEKLTVARNPYYWAEKTVALKKIEFYPIDNRASEEMAFLSGVLDVTMALPLNKVEAYKGDPRLRIDPALQVGYLLINVNRPPLDDVRVRRMLSLALNRNEICTKILRGGQTAALRFVPPELGGSPTTAMHEDAKEAREIFEQLPANIRTQVSKIVLRFNSSEERRIISEAIQARWQSVLGTKLTLENLEWKTFLVARQKSDFDLAYGAWSADFADPSNFLSLFLSDDPNNVTGWKNAAYDEAVKSREFARAEEILLNEAPVLPLYFKPNIYLIHPRVMGWLGHPMDFHDWRGIRLKH